MSLFRHEDFCKEVVMRHRLSTMATAIYARLTRLQRWRLQLANPFVMVTVPRGKRCLNQSVLNGDPFMWMAPLAKNAGGAEFSDAAIALVWIRVMTDNADGVHLAMVSLSWR